MQKININELNLEEIGQWPTQAKVGLLMLMSIFVLFLGYWLLIRPKFEVYDNLVVRHQGLRSTFEMKQAQATNLEAYIHQLKIMQEKFSEMLKKLPAEDEMPQLLEDISKTGRTSGLTFELFAPKTEVEHDFYSELPIDIIIKGTYHQLAVFLSRIGQLDRVVTLHDFSVLPVEEKKEAHDASNYAPNNTEERLEMKITAKIYRYHQQ